MDLITFVFYFINLMLIGVSFGCFADLYSEYSYLLANAPVVTLGLDKFYMFMMGLCVIFFIFTIIVMVEWEDEKKWIVM